MKKAILLIITILTFSTSIAQTKIGHVELPDKLSFNQEELVLNGAGVRKMAMLLKLYVCALYLPEKSENESAIINSDDNMNIRLVITSRRVSSKALVKAINKGFENSTGNNTSSIDNEIDSLGVLLSGKIRTGDVFDVTNQKERGVVLYKNGRELGAIKNLKFKKALFGIWLGGNPVDDDLKKGMLKLD
jgi:hypothetical protein